MEYNCENAIKVLDNNNIEYTIRHGFSNFNYIALVFNTKRKAWKAYDILKLTGTGINKEINEQASIIFYQ